MTEAKPNPLEELGLIPKRKRKVRRLTTEEVVRRLAKEANCSEKEMVQRLRKLYLKGGET